MLAQKQPAPSPAPPARESHFILGPWYDGFLFIGAPFLALAIAFSVFRLESDGEFTSVFVRGYWKNPFIPLTGMWILSQAHIFLVFGRSHLNSHIFSLFPLRFTLVPLVLVALALSSTWIAASLMAVAVLWDMYHGSLQSFGLARIYDRMAGNDPYTGRRLDIWLAHLIYMGPLIGGFNFANQLQNLFGPYKKFHLDFLLQAPNYLSHFQGLITTVTHAWAFHSL